MENFATSQAPRSPHVTELMELTSWLCEQGHDVDDATLTAGTAYVAVYDDYVTDCPGYRGKLMSVVWDGSPDCFDVFIWSDDSIVRINRDNGGC